MDKILVNCANAIINNLGDLNGRFAGKKILLTGGAGFLGCLFVHYFLKLNDDKLAGSKCQLVLWDNFIRGIPGWLKELENRSDLIVKKIDITIDTDIGNSDYIIHAASIASPIFYRKYPIETIDANVKGLRNLLDRYEKTKFESFLFFSTSEIYGDPDRANIPTSENYRGNVSCTGPRACYDESKRFGETLCVNFWQQYGVPVKIARPFNNYGPGLKITDKRVIPDFFKDVLSGNNIRILSDGKATRTFCYITDALEGYIRILLSEFNGEPFNIGCEEPEISILDLANLIIRISGKKLKVEYTKSNDPNYLVDNPNRRCPSIKKAKELLKFNPRVSLEEGIEQTYLYYLSNQSEIGRFE